MFQGFANLPEAVVVIASPVSFLGEFSIGSIRAGFPREETGRNLHRVATSVCRIFQGQPLRGLPGGGEAHPSILKRKTVGNLLANVRSLSWIRSHVLSPLDPLEPILVRGVQPGVGLMADNPRVEKVDKVRIPLIDREAGFGFEQRF